MTGPGRLRADVDQIRAVRKLAQRARARGIRSLHAIAGKRVR